MSGATDASVATAGISWEQVGRDLDVQGWAHTGPLFTPEWCDAMAGRYEDDALFRARVIMARHGFGRGEYRYLPIHCRMSSPIRVGPSTPAWSTQRTAGEPRSEWLTRTLQHMPST